jgi:hypothetical protein
MNSIAKELLQTVKAFRRNGNLYTFGLSDFVSPQLTIKGISDEITFPINNNQISALLAVAHDAPFGKGFETVYDKSVRSVREIDSKYIEIGNPNWANAISEIIEKVNAGLGLPTECEVLPELYKLLVYQPGDFFLPHKDTEKVSGMFGSLVVCLPCEHTGGALCFHVDDKKETVNLAPAATRNQIGYCAFYADVTHEVLPLRTGYRICLVYNLVLRNGKKLQTQPPSPELVNSIVKQLNRLEESVERKHLYPLLLILDHQYTPENFSAESLKLHDRERYEKFSVAAKEAGWYVRLALASQRLTGYSSQYRLDVHHSPDEFSGVYFNSHEMQESEKKYALSDYVELDVSFSPSDEPPFRCNLAVGESSIISEKVLGDGDPIAKSELYYGNEGVLSIDYEYHYGAIVFWPKNAFSYVLRSGLLEWTTYYEKPKSMEIEQEAMTQIKYFEAFLETTGYWEMELITKFLLTEVSQRSQFGDCLFDFCLKLIDERANQKPQPPLNLAIKLPERSVKIHDLERFRTYLSSPDIMSFLFKGNTHECLLMEYYVRINQLDLAIERIPEENPNMIRITKDKIYASKLRICEGYRALYESLNSMSK